MREVGGRQRKAFVPSVFVLPDVHADAAGDREPPYAPCTCRIQSVEQPDEVVAEVRDRVLGRDRAGQVHDVAELVLRAEREERVPVGDVELLHDDFAVEERRGIGTPVGRDDDLLSEVDQGAGGVGADHAEPTGNENHARDAKTAKTSTA